jgi:UDP-N-acetylmuramoyl-tripeptide--D-alanyl-D-alanine ligase
MNRYRIQDIVDSTGAKLARGDAHRTIAGVSTDTRSLASGDFFFAISGPNFDGNRFAREAIERGAAGLMLADPGGTPLPAVRDLPRDTPILFPPSPRHALSDLAQWHRRRLSAPVIGITGSCGKTTTKSILIELLSSRRRTVGSPNSFNNDIGVPHTLFLADDATEAVVVEMGTNAPGEIASLCRTAAPTAGIITNVGASHLEGLGSVQGVAKEKSALAESLPADGFCVLNADCRWTRTMRSMTPARVITFSLEGEGDLDASDVWTHSGGTTFRLDGVEITSPLLGLHNVQNLLAALAACRGLGIPLDEVLPAVSRLKAARRRLERIQVGRTTVIDDSYNANPESARASVRVLAGLHGHARRVLVLGDMLELGSLAAELHYAIGYEAAKSGIDLLVLVGELTRASAAGALEGGLDENHVVHVDTTEEAIARIGTLLADGDVVLVKGSRRTGLDRLVTHLVDAQKHEDAA